MYHYDPLNRLTKVERKVGLNAPISIDYGYDLAGNLTQKSDFTTNSNAYTYGNNTRSAFNAGPNAVSQVKLKGFSTDHYRFYEYDQNGNITRSAQGTNRTSAQDYHVITYNSNNKPTYIDDKNNGKFERFWYGSDGMRYKQITSEGVTTYYVDGIFEKVTKNNQTTTKSYIGDYAVVTRTATAKTLSYLHKDRLGSVETITDGDNTVSTVTDRNQDGTRNVLDLILEQRLYDVFGEARPKDDGNPNNDPWMINGVTSQGFTGHEHLQSGLIHMNGRAYDPDLGRFLSVDPFIAMPENGQSINPYSYVMNNPLKYTDPSGYVIDEVSDFMSSNGQLCFLFFCSDSANDGLPAPTPDSGSGSNSPDSGGDSNELPNHGEIDLDTPIAHLMVEDALQGVVAAKGEPSTKSRTWSSYLPYTNTGHNSAQYWAKKLVASGGSFTDDPFSSAGLFFSVLWTPETAAETSFTLLGGKLLSVAGKIFAGARAKIIGSAQSTGTLGHATISKIYAYAYALHPNVVRVTMDLGYRRLTSGITNLAQKYRWGARPDVAAIYKNGSIKVKEVASKTDKVDDLISRNELTMQRAGIESGSISVSQWAVRLHRLFGRR